MKKQLIRSTPFITITCCCLLLIPLAFLAAYNTPSDQWKIWFSSRLGDGAPTGEQRSLKLLLGRLVRGNDRNKLESTRFACDRAPHSVVCVANQQVRIETASLKVYVRSHNQTETLVQPYARQEDKDLMRHITPVHILQDKIRVTPEYCYHAHKAPVIVFSSGLIGNLFHEVSEIIIPLFITSRHFQSDVQFMVTDYQPWFGQKYSRVLTQLSRYQVISTGSNTNVHCFPGAVIGLKFHDNLAVNPDSIPGGYTMLDFKRFLRDAYSLKVKIADEIKNPTLLLISDGAVLIQVVPYALTWASETYFGQPAPKMGLKYLEYKTVAEESSLIGSYGPNDPVINDPQSLYSKGYQVARAVYVDGQNMTINLSRFRPTLVDALVQLGHPYPPN